MSRKTVSVKSQNPQSTEWIFDPSFKSVSNPLSRETALTCLKAGWTVCYVRRIGGEKCYAEWEKSVIRSPDHIPRGAAWWEPEVWLARTVNVDQSLTLVCIDVDERHGGAASLATLREQWGELPETVADYREGGGHHLYFWVPVDCFKGYSEKANVELARGVEFLSRNHRVALPPSNGSDGKAERYWLTQPEPGSVNVAVLPEEWQKRIKTLLNKVCAVAPGKRSNKWTVELPERIAKYMATIDPAVQGERGSGRFYYATSRLIHGFGLTPDQALPYLQAYNERCKPPFSEKEMEHTLASAENNGDKNGKPRGFLVDEWEQKKAEWEQKNAKRGKKRKPKKQTKGSDSVPNLGRFDDKGLGGDGLQEGEGEEQEAPSAEPTATDPHVWARDYIEQTKHQGAVTIRHYRGAWYQWREGRYVQLDEREVKFKLTKFIREEMDRRGIVEEDKHGNEYKVPVTPYVVNAACQALASEVVLDGEMEPPFWIEDNGLYKRLNLIAAQDGLVQLDQLLAGEPFLVSHCPRWFSTVCLPYKADVPGCDCPDWKHFIRTTLIDGDKSALFQEFAGYLLCPNTDQQKFMIMVGEGSNGKSVACSVLTALLGDDNVSNVPLEIFGDRFALSSTVGKLANIASEIGDIDKAAEGYLKAFTDGSRMHFDRKGISPIEVRPTARLILATNNLPRFSDRSKGLWRRLIVMPFTVVFSEKEQVKGMDKAEYWTKELSGIFHWAVDGLRRLKSQGFTVSAECEAALREHQRDSNPARVFIEETCKESEGDSVPTGELYKAYREWCEENGTHPLGERVFGKEVRRAFPDMRRDKVGPRSSRPWHYIGIAYSASGWGEPSESLDIVYPDDLAS